jgi:hypothetical protein
MVILQAQIEGRYPYNLSQAEFIDLVEIPQPPMKFKVAEVAAESH